ncbi:hypothetical protein FNH22_27080 [Fulvivirga sp. M361]|uniref:hypothetical protein n=1 Tax=Fulvivirga sp. M361 TaxID=2594266 RepID=UPI00117B068A|nr:hypothetical protein [Fulvivirga sp. M361]TRX49483.1 hypothetical protein FNH22_27080 [Fulvivirga sp. M361]
MYEKREIHRAIGELAYVISRAQTGHELDEKKAFFKIIEKELDFDAWSAESRFEILDEKIHPTIDHAYNEAIHEFRRYKKYLTPELKDTTLRVIEAVARIYYKSEVQQFVIDRLKNDLKTL